MIVVTGVFSLVLVAAASDFVLVVVVAGETESFDAVKAAKVGQEQSLTKEIGKLFFLLLTLNFSKFK